ncbi:MAG: hypothetical protein ACM3XS_08320, partial [Bacteroidota bacterium]
MPRKLPAFETVFRAMFGGVKLAYEHLGLTALHSAIWFILHSPLWFALLTALDNLPQPGAKEGAAVPWGPVVFGILVAGALLAAPANAAMLHVANLAREDEARIRDFFLGFKRFFLRSAGVYGSYILLVVLLIVNMTAAARMPSILGKFSLAISLYALIFVLLVSNHLFPLIVLQPQNTWRKVWKKAFLLTLDNGLLTVVLSVLTLILYGISAVLGILLVLYFPAAIGYGHVLFF